jgi:hypothetical protein
MRAERRIERSTGKPLRSMPVYVIVAEESSYGIRNITGTNKNPVPYEGGWYA